jgi:hypothetical protein
MADRDLTDAEILAQIPAATARGEGDCGTLSPADVRAGMVPQ